MSTAPRLINLALTKPLPALRTHHPLPPGHPHPGNPLLLHTVFLAKRIGEPWFHVLLEVRVSASTQLKPPKNPCRLAGSGGSHNMSPKSLLHNLIYDRGGISILWEAMDYSINGIGTTGWPSGRK